MVSNLNPSISASKSFDYIASIFSDIHLLSIFSPIYARFVVPNIILYPSLYSQINVALQAYLC